MDVTVIRIKRSREVEPLEQISVSSKRFKNDQEKPIISKVATLDNKDEPLENLFKDVVSNMRRKKLQRQHTEKSYQDMYKLKPNRSKQRHTAAAAINTANKRFQVVNKARGIAKLDDDTINYLTNSKELSLNVPEVEGGPGTTSKSNSSTSNASSDEACSDSDKFNIEVIDVCHNQSTDDDIICVNGVPMEQSDAQYVYDYYIATKPRGYLDDLSIISYPSHLEHDICSDNEEDYDSEDSNAENYRGNEYPDTESSSSSSGDESDSPDKLYSVDEKGLVHSSVPSNSLQMDDLEKSMRRINFRKTSKPVKFHGEPVPSCLESIFAGRVECGDSSLSSDDEDAIYYQQDTYYDSCSDQDEN